MFSLLPLIAALLSPAASARCDERVSPDKLSVLVSDGYAAYERGSMSDFRDRLDATREALPCLTGVVGVGTMAGVYRMEALAAFLLQNEAAVIDNFAIAHALDPDWELPERIAPPGHPLWQLWLDALKRTAFPTRPLPAHESWTLHLDGVESTERPVDRRYLLQVTDAEGDLRCSEVAGPVETERLPCRLHVNGAERARRGLLLGSGSLAAASGGLLALSVAGRLSFDQVAARIAAGQDPGMSTEDLDALVLRTNRLATAAEVGATVAVGLGLSAVVLRW